MKVQFNTSQLGKALGLLTSVVPSRTPKPILRCLHLAAEDNQVRVSATDLEVGINCLVRGVEVEEPGRAVVPADKLAAIVHESDDDVLVMHAKEDSCEIRGGDSHFAIYTQPPEQYPVVPAFDGQAELEVSLEPLKTATEQVLFAAARESTRYAINGVLWSIKGKKLSLVATDGRRLAKSVVTLVKPASGRMVTDQVIVHTKAMSLLEKISGQEKDTVQVKLEENRIAMACRDVTVTSNLVEGKFPKYEDIIPTGHDKKLTLNTDAFLSAVRRAALLTSEESRGIRLSISKDGLVVSGSAPETGDAQVSIALEYKGEPLEIGFSPQYLIDALRVIRAEQFDFELGQADRPGLIKSDNNFLYVLMPINLG